MHLCQNAGDEDVQEAVMPDLKRFVPVSSWMVQACSRLPWYFRRAATLEEGRHLFIARKRFGAQAAGAQLQAYASRRVHLPQIGNQATCRIDIVAPRVG